MPSSEGIFVAFISSHFRNNKESGEKMLRNFRNFRNLFSFRGVINSDTPKRVSRFVTPLQGVSRFATP